MASQTTPQGDVLQRIGGIGLIVGGILTLVANFLAPRPEDPSNPASIVKDLVENPDRARIAFFGILLGVWALVAGFAAVYRSITSGAGSAWARLGFYGIIAATSVFSVAFALAFATTEAAVSGEIATAESLAFAANSAFPVSFLAYWTALLFLGISIAISTAYPKWIGWVLIIASAVAAIAGGIIPILSGSSETTDLGSAAGAVASSVMSLVLGILITRRQMRAM